MQQLGFAICVHKLYDLHEQQAIGMQQKWARVSHPCTDFRKCNFQPGTHYQFPVGGAEYCDEHVCFSVLLLVCLSVCLSASQEPHVQTSPNFLSILHVAVAIVRSGRVAVCYVLPFFLMSSYFPTMGHMAWRCCSSIAAMLFTCQHLCCVVLVTSCPRWRRGTSPYKECRGEMCDAPLPCCC